MLISILIPVRNMESTISRALGSIVAQNHPQVEIVVVDGSSEDDTLIRVAEFEQHISQLVSEPDAGYYDAVNKGIELATGNVVAILNGDDYYANENVLSSYAAKFEDRSIDLVFSDVEFFSTARPDRTLRLYSSRSFRSEKLRYGWMPPHPSVFVRRQVYQQVGKYRTDYAIAADYEFLVRALLVYGVTSARIDQVSVRMQHGGISTSGISATLKLNREIIRACRENGIRSSWLHILPKFPLKAMEYLHRGQ